MSMLPIVVLPLVGGQYVVGEYQLIPRSEGGPPYHVLLRPMEVQITAAKERDAMTCVMHPFGTLFGLLPWKASMVFPENSFFSPPNILSDRDPLYTRYIEYRDKHTK